MRKFKTAFINLPIATGPIFKAEKSGIPPKAPRMGVRTSATREFTT
jgi:hypothetical protein